MFSLTRYPINKLYSQTNVPQTRSIKSFAGYDVSDLLAKGDNALNNNKFDEALKYYTEANKKNPNEIQTYRKLGKTYFNLKNYKRESIDVKIMYTIGSKTNDIVVPLKRYEKKGLFQFRY